MAYTSLTNTDSIAHHNKINTIDNTLQFQTTHLTPTSVKFKTLTTHCIIIHTQIPLKLKRIAIHLPHKNRVINTLRQINNIYNHSQLHTHDTIN
jgi:hypothetical protein